MEIRSYRRVFDLERRIYRIDHLRLNPGGVPVRGIAYSVAACLGALVCAHLPLAGLVIAPIPWFIRDLVVPVACGGLLTVTRIDGRRLDHAARALLLYALGTQRRTPVRAYRSSRVPSRWRPPSLLMLPDGSDGRLRRMRFAGPGVAHVVARHERARARGRPAARVRSSSHVLLCGLEGASGVAGRVVVLDRKASLTIR